MRGEDKCAELLDQISGRVSARTANNIKCGLSRLFWLTVDSCNSYWIKTDDNNYSDHSIYYAPWKQYDDNVIQSIKWQFFVFNNNHLHVVQLLENNEIDLKELGVLQLNQNCYLHRIC